MLECRSPQFSRRTLAWEAYLGCYGFNAGTYDVPEIEQAFIIIVVVDIEPIRMKY